MGGSEPPGYGPDADEQTEALLRSYLIESCMFIQTIHVC